MAGNVRWITADEVSENYEPKNGGGGIGGSIADQQVAFGDGTEIAGSSSLTWDNTNKRLALGGNVGGDGPVIVLDDTVNDNPPATTGDVRLPAGFHVNKLDYAGESDVNIISARTFGNGDSISIGQESVGSILLDRGAITLTGYNGVGIALTPDTGSVVLINGMAVLSDVLSLTPMAAPSSPSEGMIYAGTDHHLYYYNGTDWKQLDNTI